MHLEQAHSALTLEVFPSRLHLGFQSHLQRGRGSGQSARFRAVPPQNLVDRTIVNVCAVGVKLAYPDASLAVRPARDRPIEPEAVARTGARLAHAEPSALSVRVRILCASSPSRSSRLTSRDGQRFEERQGGARSEPEAGSGWLDPASSLPAGFSLAGFELAAGRVERPHVERQDDGVGNQEDVSAPSVVTRHRDGAA